MFYFVAEPITKTGRKMPVPLVAAEVSKIAERNNFLGPEKYWCN